MTLAVDDLSHTDIIDHRYVKKLIEMLDASTVDSIEISSDKGMKLRLSKSAPHRGMAMGAQLAMPAMMPPAAAPAAAAPAPAAGGEAAPGAPAAAAPRNDHLEVKSPPRSREEEKLKAIVRGKKRQEQMRKKYALR